MSMITPPSPLALALLIFSHTGLIHSSQAQELASGAANDAIDLYEADDAYAPPPSAATPNDRPPAPVSEQQQQQYPGTITSQPLPPAGDAAMAPGTGTRELTYEDLLDRFLGPGSAAAFAAGISGQYPDSNPATTAAPTERNTQAVTPRDNTPQGPAHADQ